MVYGYAVGQSCVRFKLAFAANPAKGRHFRAFTHGNRRKPEGPRNGADQPAIG